MADAEPARDTAASSDLSVSDLRLVDTQAAVNDDAARTVDAGAVIPSDAPTTKKASSGCSCNQGRTSSSALWPFAIALSIGALARLRRRRR